MENSSEIKTLETASNAPDNPYEVFAKWIKDAENCGEPYPTAMSLATIDPDGMPSVRTVLMRHYDEHGIVFFTNTLSRKGKALTANPVAGINFYWKALERQVRIDGTVTPVTEEEADAYFANRPRGSKIGAWASLQSQTLESRTQLKDRVAEYDEKYADDVPRPPHWSGYRIAPRAIEFWHEGEYRLHSRLLYTKTEKGWDKQMLFP